MANEEIRDGYLGDLPENIQTNIMAIHKMIINACNAELKRKLYDDIRNLPWAKEMLNEFLREPKDGDLCGSVRVYKKGKRYRCMIQVTGHPINTRNTENEELFHGFIRNVHTSLKGKIRKQFDVALTCESEHGENFEGYDIWTKGKVAAELWEKFEDKKTKIERPEKVYESLDYVYTEANELPWGLQNELSILESELQSTSTPFCLIRRYGDNVTGFIELAAVPEVMIKDAKSLNEMVDIECVCKALSIADSYNLSLTPEYAAKLATWIDVNDHTDECTTAFIGNESVVFEAATEEDNTPEYNTNMTPAVAKKTLGTATASIIQNKKVNQYTADIYANIISKNLLSTWAKGYRKLSITLDPKLKGSVFEFKIPNMTLDFVSRFVDGREPINGFLHRMPEIKIRMSEGAFKTLQNRDDAFNFFRAAVKYYDTGIMRCSDKIAAEIMKLPAEMKRLIASSKLSGIVTLPLQMLFSFDDVDMSNTSIFNISKDDISAVTNFIRGIYSTYASPAKEKQKIISDLQNIVYHLKESCDLENNKASVSSITEAVSDWYSGKYQSQLDMHRMKFEYENVDIDAMNNAPHELKRMYESTKMKKLKKIPRDLIAYITIETESIRDATDKMMIASYCLGKLEIVEWYIELLEVGSKKYIVPHSLPYLQSVRTQLLQCYANIMKVKIVNPHERPLINIPYPKNYEG